METLKINLDNLKKNHWSEEELKNVELVTDFVQNLMNIHNFEYILKNYDNSSYIQHNRNIPDGMEGIIGTIKDFTKTFPDFCYDVKQIIADGDHVVFHSHATMKKADRGDDKKGLNITDNWKIKDRQIVEHWDSIQAIDGFMRAYALFSGGKIRNSNGVF